MLELESLLSELDCRFPLKHFSLGLVWTFCGIAFIKAYRYAAHFGRIV